jgi:hypothetical protein
MNPSESLRSSGSPEPFHGASSLPETSSAVEEDVDCQLHLTEDELRHAQRVNCISAIDTLRISPRTSSRFDVPLCRLVYMPLVRPTLESDIKRLEAEFTHGYRPGATVFYVSLTNDVGEELFVTEEDKQKWGPLWNEANDRFEAGLKGLPHLSFLQNRKLFICDGNHRFRAWMDYIERMHAADADWHISVDCICLDIKGSVGLALHAMHDINRYMVMFDLPHSSFVI